MMSRDENQADDRRGWIVIYCTKCGAPGPADVNYCRKCGAHRTHHRLRKAVVVAVAIVAGFGILGAIISEKKNSPFDNPKVAATTPVESADMSADPTGIDPYVTPEMEAGEHYRANIVAILKPSQESMGAFAELMESPQIDDPGWALQLEKTIMPWRETYRAAITMNPPADWRNVHTCLLTSLSELNQAANDSRTGHQLSRSCRSLAGEH